MVAVEKCEHALSGSSTGKVYLRVCELLGLAVNRIPTMVFRTNGSAKRSARRLYAKKVSPELFILVHVLIASAQSATMCHFVNENAAGTVHIITAPLLQANHTLR